MQLFRYTVVSLCLGLASCSVEKASRAATPTAFITHSGPDRSGRLSRLPFSQAWRSPTADVSQYKHIVIRPVSTAYLPRQADSKKSGKLARKFHASLRREFSSPLCGFYLTDSAAKPGTVILETALTESGDSEFVAFEARVRDADTGKVVATVADRRETRTRTSAAIADEWSRQLMEATNKELFPRVKRGASSPF
jgi:hypothetical protein